MGKFDAESYRVHEPKAQPTGPADYPRWIPIPNKNGQKMLVKNAEEHKAVHPEDHAELQGLSNVGQPPALPTGGEAA